MSNLCNSSFTFGLIDALSQEILRSNCSFFAISLENDIWCCWKEECELISFVPPLQNGISTSVTAVVSLRISTSSMHQPHRFLGCGSTERQREAKCHSWIYTWVSGSTRHAALLTQANKLLICWGLGVLLWRGGRVEIIATARGQPSPASSAVGEPLLVSATTELGPY